MAGGKGGEDVAYAAVVAGDDEVVADVGEGLQDEAAFGPAGVRDDEAAAADGLAVVVDEVYVYDAGGVLAEGAFAAQGEFYFLEVGEEFVGVQGGAENEDGVVEVLLGVFGGDADGFGFVDGGGGEKLSLIHISSARTRKWAGLRVVHWAA